jgi:hypothetical protein
VASRSSSRISPALIVALLALFMALSGTTYAVTHLSPRSVGSLQLRKGAVHKDNLATGAVTVSKLAKGMTPARAHSRAHTFRADASYALRAGFAENAGQADLATLADKATLADSAGSATTANSAARAGSVPNADTLGGRDSSWYFAKGTIVDIPRFSLGDDETQVMISHGPFTVTARCFINQIATDDADILISTTQTHSAFHGFTNNPDLNPGDPQSKRSVLGVEGLTGLPQFESAARGTAVAPDGSEIRSMVLYAGLNLFGQVGRCTFGGLAIL